MGIFIIALIGTSCASSGYRFERMDGAKSTGLALTLNSRSGVRDGDIVNAEAIFTSGADSVRLNIVVHLGPPVAFRSGHYRAVFGGQASEGTVISEALRFQGGQDIPSIGGVFVLKNAQSLPVYRVTLPSTPVQRRISP